MAIKAVLFDFDGTLTRPGAMDFAAVRREIGCPPGEPILEFIARIPSDDRRAEVHRILDRFETEAAASSLPNPGAEEVFDYLRRRGLQIGIVTRNSVRSVSRALENFPRLRPESFDVLISRDDDVPAKPDPQSILEAARRLGRHPSEVVVIGDYVHDIDAGRNAGALTVFLSHEDSPVTLRLEPDFTIESLSSLPALIDRRIPLRLGKLPNPLLQEFLGRIPDDDALLIPPGVGEDAAALRWPGSDILVLKSDPVTFATGSIGRYAVAVNANDIATCGAAPRWLLATLLFPPGTSAAEVGEVMSEMREVAGRQGLVLCGGHTEITDAVTRPVVVGMVAGTVEKSRLIDKRRMRRGDRVLVTKAVAVEGTAVLAQEFPELLAGLGMTASELERCRNLLESPGISIRAEARIAADSGGASAMHDVTEGGLVTALDELSVAGRHRIRIDLDRIPYLDETRRICGLLAIEPLGLIGSGSLLITCRPEFEERIRESIRKEGIAVTGIGEVLEPGEGIEAVESGRPARWPRFEVDEIARVYAARRRSS